MGNITIYNKEETMIIFGQPVTKENARKIWDTYKREIVALSVAFILGAIIF